MPKKCRKLDVPAEASSPKYIPADVGMMDINADKNAENWTSILAKIYVPADVGIVDINAEGHISIAASSGTS